MARSALAIQTATPLGLAAAFTSADVNGHTIKNNEKTVLIVKNGSGSSITVTLTPGGTANGYTVTPIVVTVAASAESFLGPFASYPFEATGRNVLVDFSAVTTVTVAAVSL